MDPSAPQLAYVPTPSGTIHVRVAGTRRPHATPVVLLHHTPSSSAAMVAVMAALAPRWTVAPDLPGFGSSPALAGAPDVARWATAIAWTLHRLEVGRATLFGHHAGAAVAARVAAEHPELVEHLVLSAPPLLDAEARAALERRIAPPEPPDPDGAHLAVAWARVAAKSPGLALDVHHREAALALAAGPGYPDAYAAVLRFDLAAALRRVRCPTTVVIPPDDPLAALGPAAAAVVRGATVRLAAGGAHVCDERPDLVAHAICTAERRPHG